MKGVQNSQKRRGIMSKQNDHEVWMIGGRGAVRNQQEVEKSREGLKSEK